MDNLILKYTYTVALFSKDHIFGALSMLGIIHNRSRIICSAHVYTLHWIYYCEHTILLPTSTEYYSGYMRAQGVSMGRSFH